MLVERGGTISHLTVRYSRYPRRALVADYARAGVGLAVSLAPLAAARPAPAMAWALGAAAALFLVYFMRTVERQLTQFTWDEAGIRAEGPLGASIRWDDLRSLRLAYYSTRRDREEGWMQLKLGDARRSIRTDSDLAGFADLVRAAAAHAARRGIELDAATRSNLAGLAGG